jgi:hypothetical protein
VLRLCAHREQPGDGHDGHDGQPGLTAFLDRTAPTLRRLELIRVGARAELSDRLTGLEYLGLKAFEDAPAALGSLSALSGLTSLDAPESYLYADAPWASALRSLKELKCWMFLPKVGGAALAPSVTSLRCCLASPGDDLDGLAAAFPAVTHLELGMDHGWIDTSPQTAMRWRGLRSLGVFKATEDGDEEDEEDEEDEDEADSWRGTIELLRGGDGGLTHLSMLLDPPTPNQFTEVLWLTPALEELKIMLPRDGDLVELFTPLLAASTAAGSAGPGQRLTHLSLDVDDDFDFLDLHLSAAGLLAMGRALPALTSLDISCLTTAVSEQLQRALGATVVADQDGYGYEHPELLLAVRAALARLGG